MMLNEKFFRKQPQNYCFDHTNSGAAIGFLRKDRPFQKQIFQRYMELARAMSGGYNYRIVRKRLKFPNLPWAFSGTKIVHISDIHAGNLKDKDSVYQGIKMIMNENPSCIFFTGDMVSHQTTEVFHLIDVLSHLKADTGIYTVLGNHDYTGSKTGRNSQNTLKNLEILENAYSEMGWNLLNNRSEVIDRKRQSISVVGTENWSSVKRFPRYGNVEKAKQGSEKAPFKMLLTHDPSHWEAGVLNKHDDIDITFSGHTHGFQFGIGLGENKWSPAQYVHKYWKGLYRHKKQYLYVNPGFGFIGMPGRIGMPPEITVMELEAA